jgi:hypothetical protein
LIETPLASAASSLFAMKRAAETKAQARAST